MKLTGFFALVWFIGAIVGFFYMFDAIAVLQYWAGLVVAFMVLYGAQQIVRGAL